MPAEMRATELIMPEEITYPGMDGTPVPALLFNPAGQKPFANDPNHPTWAGLACSK